jgi:hypothetical protein
VFYMLVERMRGASGRLLSAPVEGGTPKLSEPRHAMQEASAEPGS